MGAPQQTWLQLKKWTWTLATAGLGLVGLELTVAVYQAICTGGEAAGDWESPGANDYIFDIDTDDAALQLYFRNGHEKFHNSY